MSVQANHVSGDLGLEDFMTRCEEGLLHQLQGDSEPLLAQWSHGAEVAILGAIGSYARGWEDVRSHILGAAKALKALNWTGLRVERVVTHVADGMAASVWLERATREAGEPRARTLRVTHVYRREQGQWRLILRHANPVSAEDEATERSLLST